MSGGQVNPVKDSSFHPFQMFLVLSYDKIRVYSTLFMSFMKIFFGFIGI